MDGNATRTNDTRQRVQTPPGLMSLQRGYTDTIRLTALLRKSAQVDN